MPFDGVMERGWCSLDHIFGQILLNWILLCEISVDLFFDDLYVYKG